MLAIDLQIPDRVAIAQIKAKYYAETLCGQPKNIGLNDWSSLVSEALEKDYFLESENELYERMLINFMRRYNNAF